MTQNGNQFVVDPRRGPRLGRDRRDALRQVVINLLSNAGKFTKNGAVTLRVNRAIAEGRDTIVISVEDTGIGISPVQLDKLFTEFNQAEASTSSRYGGTGLGLAVSRKLCQLMRGDISVASQVAPRLDVHAAHPRGTSVRRERVAGRRGLSAARRRRINQ